MQPKAVFQYDCFDLMPASDIVAKWMSRAAAPSPPPTPQLMLPNISTQLLVTVNSSIHRLIKLTPGFTFTPRSRAHLPAGFPEQIGGISYFLDDYEFPDVRGCGSAVDHVALAVTYYNIKDGVS